MKALVSDIGPLESGVPIPADAPDTDASRPTDEVMKADAGSRSAMRIWSRPVARAGALVGSICLVIAASWIYFQAPHHSDRHQPTATTHPASHPTSQRGSGTTTTPRGVVPLPRGLSGDPAGHLTALVDHRAGYRLEYPDTWTAVAGGADRSQAVSSHVIRISSNSAFSVSSFRLEHPVTTTKLADLRAVTDAILSSPDAKLVVLDVREVAVGGLPAVYYLYYFPDGKRRGIHAHYFIFSGRTMDTLVFQVVPDSQFVDYAAQFDQVVASFEPLTN